MAVERAQAGDLALERRRLGRRLAVAAERELGDEPGQAGVVERERVAARAPQPVAELEEVGAVRLERVARQAALELEVCEEVEHEVLVRLGGTRDGHAREFAGTERLPPCATPRSAATAGGAARASRSASWSRAPRRSARRARTAGGSRCRCARARPSRPRRPTGPSRGRRGTPRR